MWLDFEKSSTIGKRGVDGGITIFDVEHVEGARISLEKDSDIAAYEITLGIYGFFFHTIFCSDALEADFKFNECKEEISKFFELIPEDGSISDECYTIIEKICNTKIL